MRFVFKNAGYAFGAIKEELEPLPLGGHKRLKQGYIVKANPNDVTDWEREAARTHFFFRGTVLDVETGERMNPTHSRIGTWDSSTVDDPALREQIEQRLLKDSAYGQDFIAVEKPRIPAPWPAYDKAPHGSIGAKVAELGIDPESVILYERENKNRPSVIEQLEALVKPDFAEV